MTTPNAQKSRIIVGDFALSGYMKDWEANSDTDMLDATVATDTAKTFLPGLDTSKLTVGGLLDMDGTALTGHLAQLDSWKSAQAVDPVSFGPNGLALGSELWMVGAFEAQMKTGAAVGGIASFGLEAQASGQTDYGVSLHDLTAETADASGSSVDGTAASSNGGAGHLHVTAFSGFTGLDVIIEDSANNSTWSTILTFSTATGQTSERQAITGTVRRYVRCSWDVTGTPGSVTFSCGFARR